MAVAATLVLLAVPLWASRGEPESRWATEWRLTWVSPVQAACGLTLLLFLSTALFISSRDATETKRIGAWLLIRRTVAGLLAVAALMGLSTSVTYLRGGHPVGVGVVRLTDHGADDGEPAWSPDGARIVFRHNLYGDRIMVTSKFGGDAVWLAVGRDPAWSSDGLLIAFVSGRDGNDEIYTVRAVEWWSGRGRPTHEARI